MVETVFSANNRQEVFVLPFTPTELVFSEPQNNSVFDGLSRGRGCIGIMQPRTASFSLNISLVGLTLWLLLNLWSMLNFSAGGVKNLYL